MFAELHPKAASRRRSHPGVAVLPCVLVPQERWQELVEDVEAGRLSTSLVLEPPLRAALESLLRPDPGRAAQLRAHFQQGFRGIAGRLWSRLNLVLAVDSGSNQIYGEMLRDHYCRGVEIYSPFYAATEGRRARAS